MIPHTLEKEYLREDKNAGLPIEVPKIIIPTMMIHRASGNMEAHANLLYSNWLNYFVYQTSPYDITQINQNQ